MDHVQVKGTQSPIVLTFEYKDIRVNSCAEKGIAVMYMLKVKWTKMILW